jgi:hypothetical protein
MCLTYSSLQISRFPAIFLRKAYASYVLAWLTHTTPKSLRDIYRTGPVQVELVFRFIFSGFEHYHL